MHHRGFRNCPQPMRGSLRRTVARRRVAVLAAAILTLGLAVGGPATPVGQEGPPAYGYAVDSALVSPDEVGAPITAPPAVQFSSASYNVAESGGGTVITVTRTGSSVGKVTVDYTTSDGSAMATSDYITTSGTITFGDGDTSIRSNSRCQMLHRVSRDATVGERVELWDGWHPWFRRSMASS